MKFPLFRKYSNNKSFFKIDGPDRFTEIQIIGNQFLVHNVEVRIMPERFYLQDMMECAGGRWMEIQENEFQKVKDLAESNSSLS